MSYEMLPNLLTETTTFEVDNAIKDKKKILHFGINKSSAVHGCIRVRRQKKINQIFRCRIAYAANKRG